MNRTYLVRFLENYFRHRWLNLIPLIMMIVIGAAWAYTSKPQYIAHGTIHIQGTTLLTALTSDGQNQASWGNPSEVTTSELKSLLETDAFIRSVVKGSDLEPEMSNGPRAVNKLLARVRSHIWVDKLGQNMVVVNASDTSPAVAQQLAAGVMQNYVQWRVNMDGEGASAQTYFEKLIPSYQEALNTARQDLQAYLAQHPDPVRGDRPTAETLQIERLQAAVRDATSRLDDAVTKSQTAQLAGTRAALNAQDIFSVVDAPQVPTDPATSRRKLLLNVLVFVVAGLLLSAIAVVGAALMDTTLRFPVDVRERLGLPVLGAVPDVPAGPATQQQERVQAGNPMPAVQQA